MDKMSRIYLKYSRKKLKKNIHMCVLRKKQKNRLNKTVKVFRIVEVGWWEHGDSLLSLLLCLLDIFHNINLP